MTVDDEKLEQEFLRLTDDNQAKIEVEFGRLIERYRDIHSQIDNLTSIIADENGKISPHSFGMTDQEKFTQWRQENQEAVNKSPELIEEFEDILSEVGVGIDEDVDRWERDKMENKIGDELTEMYWNLFFASAVSRSEADQSTENSQQNQGLLSKFRSKF